MRMTRCQMSRQELSPLHFTPMLMSYPFLAPSASHSEVKWRIKIQGTRSHYPWWATVSSSWSMRISLFFCLYSTLLFPMWGHWICQGDFCRTLSRMPVMSQPCIGVLGFKPKTRCTWAALFLNFAVSAKWICTCIWYMWYSPSESAMLC